MNQELSCQKILEFILEMTVNDALLGMLRWLYVAEIAEMTVGCWDEIAEMTVYDAGVADNKDCRTVPMDPTVLSAE